MFEIQWTVFLEVKNQQKAEKILRKIEADLGKAVDILESESYRKIENYWKVRFSIDLQAKDIPSAVFETLCHCDSLSNNWDITTPQIFENGQIELTGTSIKNLRIIGLKMADFYMKTKLTEN